MKINISAIKNEKAISDVELSSANSIVGGDGVGINWNILINDGGLGAANADIGKFDFAAQTIDIDAGNSPVGIPWHQATITFSGSMGD